MLLFKRSTAQLGMLIGRYLASRYCRRLLIIPHHQRPFLPPLGNEQQWNPEAAVPYDKHHDHLKTISLYTIDNNVGTIPSYRPNRVQRGRDVHIAGMRNQCRPSITLFT